MKRQRLYALLRVVLLTVLGQFMALKTMAAPACVDLFARLSESQRLTDKEVNSPSRQAWIREQNANTNAKLKESPNKKNIEAWMRDYFKEGDSTTQEVLADKSELVLETGALGKPDRMILKKDNREESLFSTFDIRKNGSVRLIDFKMSPDEKLVALVLAEKGSLDRFSVFIYDLEKRAFFADSKPVRTSDESISWDERKLIFEYGSRMYLDTMVPGSEPVKLDYGFQAKVGNYILGWKDGYFLRRNGFDFKLSSSEKTEIIGNDTEHVFLKVADGDDATKIVQLKRKLDDAENKEETLATFSNTVVRRIKTRKAFLVVMHAMGAKQTVSIIAKSGQRLADIELPTGTSAAYVLPGETEKKLAVYLKSPVQEKIKFTYDIEKKEFEIGADEVRRQMLTKENREFESKIEMTKSADGTEIPVRLTYLKKLKRDGSAPAFMKVYGGFAKSSGFYPSYDGLMLDFMERGGIVVDAAIRGGNEFGEAWHTAAMKENKRRTIEDVIATSKFLARNKYSRPEKVILTGTSNGGFVVAASGLLGPENFGLVIPVNGVDDMLEKDSLDSEFGGWAGEFGDATDADAGDYLSLISPVELAAKGKRIPQFLIINGQNDSRVNPAHSFKLQAALEKYHPGSSTLAALKNSGHHNQSVENAGLIGWRVNVVIWTQIYDLLGWRR